MDGESCKQSETKQREMKQRNTECINTKRTEADQIETEQDGMKVVLEFPKQADECEEAVMQEIRTLLVDMLREHCKKHSTKGADPL